MTFIIYHGSAFFRSDSTPSAIIKSQLELYSPGRVKIPILKDYSSLKSKRQSADARIKAEIEFKVDVQMKEEGNNDEGIYVHIQKMRLETNIFLCM